jgi:hypothetical protein
LHIEVDCSNYSNPAEEYTDKEIIPRNLALVFYGICLRVWRRVIDVDCLRDIEKVVRVSNLELRRTNGSFVSESFVRVNYSSSLVSDG